MKSSNSSMPQACAWCHEKNVFKKFGPEAQEIPVPCYQQLEFYRFPSLVFCPNWCWYEGESPDQAWSSGYFCLPFGYCCFSVKWCQPFYVQRHAYLIWIEGGPGGLQLFPGELGSRLTVIPGRGRCCSRQIKSVLGLTCK